MGHSGTVINSVYEGYPVPGVTKSVEYGGELMNKLFKEKCKFLSDFSDERMDKFKREKGACCITENVLTDMLSPKANESVVVQLPNQDTGVVKRERYSVPECMFTPSLYGLQCPGVHEMVYNCGMAMDYEVRKDMFNNIIISGGCSKIAGVKKRIKDSLSQWGIDGKVIEPQEEYQSWIGASILSSLSTFEDQWLFKYEWEDEGDAIIRKKFII